MRSQWIVVMILVAATALFAAANPTLLARQMTVNLFVRTYDGPFLAVLLGAMVATWALLLIVGALTQWGWNRSLQLLAAELKAKEEEIVRLKAVAFDRQQVAPVGAPPSTAEPSRPVT